MFISKKTITKIAVLLAFITIAILPAKAELDSKPFPAQDYCKSFRNVSNEPGDYYENQYFKFRMLQGMKITETAREYEVGEYFLLSKPKPWKNYVIDHVAPLFRNVIHKFTDNPLKELSEKNLDTKETDGPYGQPVKGTIKTGTLHNGERFIRFKTGRTFADIGNVFYSTTVLIKARDGRFLMADSPDTPACSTTRNSVQFELLLSTLEIKYPKIPKIQTST